MKKICSLFLALSFLLLNFTAVSAKDSSVSWFIKRNGNNRPPLAESQKIIENYDAYYIDMKVSDDCDDKVLYLTFDVGYENGNTEKILNVLKEEKIPAAFFVLDNIILKNTDLVTRMAEEGHLVCNHTKNHKDLSGATKEQIERNLTALEKLYYEKTGKEMAKYFRFPEGKYSESALKHLQDMGYKTIFWSFAYADWDNSSQMTPEKAIKKVLDNTHNGAVILLHPTSKTNAEILPELILRWREAGYRFSTLDELIKS